MSEQNLFGQSPWERRGENDGRIQSLEVSRTADEATLALIHTGAWIDYTPVWTASGGATGLGAGSVTGRYMLVGRLIHWYCLFTYGAGMSLPAGNYYLSLPAAASPVSAPFQGMPAWYSDASTGLFYIAMASPNFAGADYSKVAVQFHGVAAAWGPATPLAPGVGDLLQVSGAYEAAT